jgi:hypothetical protein
MKYPILRTAGFVLAASSLLTIAMPGCGKSTASPTSATAGKAKAQAGQSEDLLAGSGKGMDAIRQAAGADKFLFMFFSKTDDDKTLAMRKVFDKAMEKMADRVQWIAINITDPAEKDIVAKFGLDRGAPIPMVLARAPNGALTGSLFNKFEEKELLDALVSPVLQKVLKNLQSKRLVFVCVQNDKTKLNDAAMQGVRDFKADDRFADATEIVMLDPSDPAEAPFLADMKIDPKTEEAMTVFLAPPGSPIAEYKGATDKAELAETLQKASSGSCGPGGSCGPSGCGPK